MKKILFITPPYHCGVVEVAGRWVPLTFVYLAGAAREIGFEPIIYDAMTKFHGYGEIEKVITDVKPHYVATTAITSTIVDALNVLKLAKDINPNIITIIGGVHPSFLYEEVLQNQYVDYVVREEGEETLKELLLTIESGRAIDKVKGIAYRVNGKAVAGELRPFIKDLDAIPKAWDLIDWKDYKYFVIPNSRLGTISTSRGCSHNCTFCSQQKFWHQKWRARNPKIVVDEIKHLLTTYGVNVFLIPDEYPTNDRDRWERFLDLMIRENLGVYLLMETRAADIVRDRDILWKYRKAGVVHVYVGLEAVEQESLDYIKKDSNLSEGKESLRLLREHGIITETSFILGLPDETMDSIEKTLRFAIDYNPDFAHFLAIAPWPYADMYNEMKEYIKVFDYRKYNLIDPVIKPKNMTLEDIDRAMIDCYRAFYMNKYAETLEETDEFKKGYMITSMKLIMNSSFIKKKMGELGSMPEEVRRIIES